MRLFTKPIELKTLDDESGAYEGYAATFGNRDRHNDVIFSGAFSKTILNRDPKTVPGLWQHNWDEPISATTSIEEDEVGLKVKGNLVMEVAKAREARALAKAGVLGGLSIGYIPVEWEWKEDGTRALKEIELLEYSFVTIPANPKARIADVKAATLSSVRDCEAYLRDVCGLSIRESKLLISRIRDADDRDDHFDNSPELKDLYDRLSAINQSF